MSYYVDNYHFELNQPRAFIYHGNSMTVYLEGQVPDDAMYVSHDLDAYNTYNHVINDGDLLFHLMTDDRGSIFYTWENGLGWRTIIHIFPMPYNQYDSHYYSPFPLTNDPSTNYLSAIWDFNSYQYGWSTWYGSDYSVRDTTQISETAWFVYNHTQNYPSNYHVNTY